ncbi:hypothetical protein KC351_g2534 [Hortaea werneckii]|nr:hypothetical protein KC351_g2534 [Hortaea werneckii]
MRLFRSLALAAVSYSSAVLAAGWSFEDATLTVQGKGAGVGGGVKESLTPQSALPGPVSLASGDTLKIALTTTNGKAGKKPHQAFFTLQEPTTGLEESFPFSLKDNGKGKVEITQKDLPYQLATSQHALKASIIIASFGTSDPYNKNLFDLTVVADAFAPPTVPSPAERYGKKEEIHHIFKDGPQSPNFLLVGVFTVAVCVTLPILSGVWAALGGNVSHFGTAFGKAPLAHGLFLGSILAMEGVFFLYYTVWNLFQMLPAAAVVGVVGYVSGSRALTEVQERRLAGQR